MDPGELFLPCDKVVDLTDFGQAEADCKCRTRTTETRCIKANSLVIVSSYRMLSVSGSPTPVRPPLCLPAPLNLFGGSAGHDLEVFRYNIVPAVPS